MEALVKAEVNSLIKVEECLDRIQHFSTILILKEEFEIILEFPFYSISDFNLLLNKELTASLRSYPS